jgi:hypothetical protein
MLREALHKTNVVMAVRAGNSRGFRKSRTGRVMASGTGPTE